MFVHFGDLTLLRILFDYKYKYLVFSGLLWYTGTMEQSSHCLCLRNQLLYTELV